MFVFALLEWIFPAAMLACSRPVIRCPAGSAANQAREEELRRYIELPKAKGVCWGKWPISVVDQDARLLLNQDLGPKEAAARAAHLHFHIGKQAPRDTTCLQWWVDQEATAMALELELYRKWGVSAARFGHAAGYYRAVDGHSYLRTYIESHPNGAKGMDGLYSAYQKRCQKTLQP